mgnify:CR=1 FL=1
MEIWRDIKGFEGYYQISNLGRVKNVSNSQIRKTHPTRDGYLKIRLLHNGKDVTARIHRLVAEAFIPNPDNKETVNHKDGNKLNNNVENLEWMDRSEQMYHAYNHELKKSIKGVKNTNSKLTENEIRQIRKEYVPYDRNYSTVALSKKYGVTNRVIGLIVRGLAYQDVK